MFHPSSNTARTHAHTSTSMLKSVVNFCSRDFLFHKEFDDSMLAKRHIVVSHFVRSDTSQVMQAIGVTRHSRITQQLVPSTTALYFICCSQFACKKKLLMTFGTTLVYLLECKFSHFLCTQKAAWVTSWIEGTDINLNISSFSTNSIPCPLSLSLDHVVVQYESALPSAEKVFHRFSCQKYCQDSRKQFIHFTVKGINISYIPVWHLHIYRFIFKLGNNYRTIRSFFILQPHKSNTFPYGQRSAL